MTKYWTWAQDADEIYCKQTTGRPFMSAMQAWHLTEVWNLEFIPSPGGRHVLPESPSLSCSNCRDKLHLQSFTCWTSSCMKQRKLTHAECMPQTSYGAWTKWQLESRWPASMPCEGIKLAQAASRTSCADQDLQWKYSISECTCGQQLPLIDPKAAPPSMIQTECTGYAHIASQ